MIRHLALVTSLVLIPSIAMSQRSRTQSDRKTELFEKDNGGSKGPTLRVRDLEDMSPVKLIIDKRKDLKLTDAQLTSLKDAENKLKEKNAPLFSAVDSLMRDMRSGGAGPSDADRAKVSNARAGLMNTIGDVKTNYEAAAKDAIATLDPEQQAKANEMLAKQREDGDKTVREKTMVPANRRPGDPPPHD